MEDFFQTLQKFEYTTRSESNTIGGDIDNTDYFLDKFPALEETIRLRNSGKLSVFTEKNLQVLITSGHLHDYIDNVHAGDEFPAMKIVDIFYQLCVEEKIDNVFTEAILLSILDDIDVVGKGDVDGHIMFGRSYNVAHMKIIEYFDILFQKQLLKSVLTMSTYLKLLSIFDIAFTKVKGKSSDLRKNKRSANYDLKNQLLKILELFLNYPNPIQKNISKNDIKILKSCYTMSPSYFFYDKETLQKWRDAKKILVLLKKI